MEKKPTMKDVAEKAGVSTATVGRVLHSRGFVSPEARNNVETAIKQTGYRINILAQSLRKQKTHTIGHLLTSIAPNPFFAGVALGVEQEAIRNGFSVLIWNVFEDPAREKKGVETFIQRQVDAIIFTTPIEAENVKMVIDAGIPAVQVERPTRVPSHAVMVDNYSGSASAVTHLIQLGHKKIGFIGGDPNLYHTNPYVEEQRLSGYRDTLVRAGITPDETWWALGKYYSIEDGYRFMKQFLAAGGFTAVFASCDILAAGALQAIYEEKLRIPDDISFIGFDDTYAAYLSPPLTTVEQPMIHIGRTAARITLDAMKDKKRSSQIFRVENLATTLKIRSSTGRPKSG